MGSTAMRLCHLSELPDGQARGFDPLHPLDPPGGRQHTMLVVRQGHRLHGWRDACPHHGTPMAWRRHEYLNAARDRIVCAAHGAQFRIDTGECTLGPCLGQSLTPVPLRLTRDGEVHLAAIPSEETSP